MNIALFIFNRPELTKRVFAIIAKAKPEVLLVVADGPRHVRDVQKCNAARVVTEHVNWPCRVMRNYSDKNLGCKVRVSSGLHWVFSEVEEAIILEDDTLPNLDFFRFCDDMLDRYRHDCRVGHISGVNFHPEVRRSPYSYFFSRYASVWGWGTWRRAWRYYDVDMKVWPELKAGHWHYDLFTTSNEIQYFERNWSDLAEKKIDTWDGQWMFACMAQGMLSIRPSVNLVSNLGFGADVDATHTTFDHDVGGMTATSMEFPLKHPPFVVVDKEADIRLSKMVFQSSSKVPLDWLRKQFLNRYWYGGLIRKIPLIGQGWRMLRGISKP